MATTKTCPARDIQYWRFPVRVDGMPTGEEIVIAGTLQHIRDLLSFNDDMIADLRRIHPKYGSTIAVDITLTAGRNWNRQRGVNE